MIRKQSGPQRFGDTLRFPLRPYRFRFELLIGSAGSRLVFTLFRRGGRHPAPSNGPSRSVTRALRLGHRLN